MIVCGLLKKENYMDMATKENIFTFLFRNGIIKTNGGTVQLLEMLKLILQKFNRKVPN